MHLLPNQATVKYFRFTAFLILVKWLLITASFPLFGYAQLVDRRDLNYLAIGFFVFSGVISISHWMVGRQAKCPMCLVPSFSHQQHAKSRKAKHFLGSYRLFVALGVIFKGWFHCPYCAVNVAIQSPHRH